MNRRLAERREKKLTKVRSNVQGTSQKPRLSVFRSAKHIYAQLIDDANGKTLAAVSTKTKEIQEEVKNAKTKTEKSLVVGEQLGKIAVQNGILSVAFDRGYYRFHGRVKALADGARKAGLNF